MTKRVLIIDDELSRSNKLMRAAKSRGYEEDVVTWSITFDLDLINEHELIFLDNDLGEGGDVYYHFKEVVEDVNFEGKTFIVHSMNPIAGEQIKNLLLDYTNRVIRLPFISI